MPSKYGARKTYCGSVRMDSKKEAERFQALLLLQRSGVIRNLQRQVKYELIPAQVAPDGERVRRCSYVADFVYERDGELVVEDVKPSGPEYKKTAAWSEYMIKKKLMLQVHGIWIREV